VTITDWMAAWGRERRVSRAAWRLEQAERERAWALASARLDPLVDRHLPDRASRVQETGRHSGADGSIVTGSSAALIATAVCEALCGSTPIITAAMEYPSPWTRAKPWRARLTPGPSGIRASLSHATARPRQAGTSFVSQATTSPQAVRKPAHRDLSTLRPDSLPSRPGSHRLPGVSVRRLLAPRMSARRYLPYRQPTGRALSHGHGQPSLEAFRRAEHSGGGYAASATRSCAAAGSTTGRRPVTTRQHW
jgi:hypothetical protein